MIISNVFVFVMQIVFNYNGTAELRSTSAMEKGKFKSFAAKDTAKDGYHKFKISKLLENLEKLGIQALS